VQWPPRRPESGSADVGLCQALLRGRLPKADEGLANRPAGTLKIMLDVRPCCMVAPSDHDRGDRGRFLFASLAQFRRRTR
jgi:hypothetical protein